MVTIGAPAKQVLYDKRLVAANRAVLRKARPRLTSDRISSGKKARRWIGYGGFGEEGGHVIFRLEDATCLAERGRHELADSEDGADRSLFAPTVSRCSAPPGLVDVHKDRFYFFRRVSSGEAFFFQNRALYALL